MEWSKLVIPALLAFQTTIAAGGFTAFKDSAYTQPLEITSDEETIVNTLVTDRSITDWDLAAGRWYDAMEYHNATSSGSASGTGSADVCPAGVADDQPAAGESHPEGGHARMLLFVASGMLSISVDEVAIDERDLVDSAGEKAETAKRAPVSNAGRAVDYVKASKRIISGDPLVGRDDVPACTISRGAGTPYKTSGIQRSVTQPEICDTGPGTCSHSVSVSTEASTALSKSSSSSWTVTGGGSIAVDAGVDFVVDTKVTTTFSYSVAKAWSSETGTTITTSTTNGTTQTLVLQVGTTAFLSFTPDYQCWQSDANCGKDADGNDIIVSGVDFCQPLTGGDGKLSGTCNVVYISN
ncbi:Uu.00g024660.m01.CDS01 [Anthostomella pinea]|uniref:Uu.00g024660.m01.CDS01 n=1 Tax=Anthostomella pinea TaxID=933095 RepID=A0AAI8W0C6_9PEZI|nr:Uu.00g024660.m01.CDS01 [Anthostomella pinea]